MNQQTSTHSTHTSHMSHTSYRTHSTKPDSRTPNPDNHPHTLAYLAAFDTLLSETGTLNTDREHDTRQWLKNKWVTITKNRDAGPAPHTISPIIFPSILDIWQRNVRAVIATRQQENAATPQLHEYHTLFNHLLSQLGHRTAAQEGLNRRALQNYWRKACHHHGIPTDQVFPARIPHDKFQPIMEHFQGLVLKDQAGANPDAQPVEEEHP